tara:strand:- start:4033 stop:4233 length:201 start_codon:yes stop_codon:yes gene_type:complete
MDIYATLKFNKIKKLEFARRIKLNSTQALKYAVNNRSEQLQDSLLVVVLEKSGINIEELIKDKIIN